MLFSQETLLPQLHIKIRTIKQFDKDYRQDFFFLIIDESNIYKVMRYDNFIEFMMGLEKP